MIRPETALDHDAIRDVEIAAFLDHPFSIQTEHLIVEELREAGALEISLVAEVDGRVVGHIAFSRARLGDTPDDWYLLGPVGVLPESQGRGIGRALIEAGLAELRSRDASGCVLVGDPAFYRRFGFTHIPGLTCVGVPEEYVLCLPLASPPQAGEVVHHAAFSVKP